MLTLRERKKKKLCLLMSLTLKAGGDCGVQKEEAAPKKV
jgi:hypothetical protein